MHGGCSATNRGRRDARKYEYFFDEKSTFDDFLEKTDEKSNDRRY